MITSQKTDVSCFSGSLFVGQLTLETLNRSLVGRTDVLWNLLKGQQLQGLLVCPFGPNIPGMLCYLGIAASVLTLERCLSSVNWVKVLEHSTTPPHPHLAIYVCFLFVFGASLDWKARVQSSDFCSVLKEDYLNFLTLLFNSCKHTHPGLQTSGIIFIIGAENKNDLKMQPMDQRKEAQGPVGHTLLDP